MNLAQYHWLSITLKLYGLLPYKVGEMYGLLPYKIGKVYGFLPYT